MVVGGWWFVVCGLCIEYINDINAMFCIMILMPSYKDFGSKYLCYLLFQREPFHDLYSRFFKVTSRLLLIYFANHRRPFFILNYNDKISSEL